MSDVNNVQSTNPKANQQPDGKKKQRKKGKGDKKPTNNVDRGNTEKKKMKYPCNLCKEDHPTYQCPRLVEAQKLLAQQ
jgi:ribosomal protein L44E